MRRVRRYYNYIALKKIIKCCAVWLEVIGCSGYLRIISHDFCR